MLRRRRRLFNAAERPDDYGVDSLKVTDDDAAFILGKGGKTKEKIWANYTRIFELIRMGLT